MASPPASLAESTLDEQQRTLIECCLCAAQLYDPVQLDCLHDCCKACAEKQLATSAAAAAFVAGAGAAAIAAAAAVDNDTAGPAQLGGVTCPICNETTDGARLSSDLFFDGHVRFLSILSGRPWCDVCPALHDAADDSKETRAERQEAEALCFDCRKLLCSDCLQEHRRLHGTHVFKPLDQIASSTEVAERCFPLCPRHGESIDHACLSCELPLCGLCARDCEGRQHKVQALHCTSVKNSVNTVKGDVESFGRMLVRIADLRQRQDALTGDLADVRREGLKLLRRNKDAVLDAVERAHKKAEEALSSGCDELKKEADEQATAAARLHERAAHSRLVGQCVINSDHSAAVLSKRKSISERLRHLTAELNCLDPEEDKERSVSYMEMQGGKLPDNVELDRILEFLIGLPKLVRGTNVVNYAHERNIHAERIERESQLRQQEQNANKDELQHQVEGDEAQSSIEQPAFSTPSSPSSSALQTPTSSTNEEAPFFKQPASPHLSESCIGQFGGDTNRRKRVKRQRKEFILQCSDCGSLVTESVNLRILCAQADDDESWIIQHHLVTDMQFPSRVRVHRHWKPSFIGKTADSGFTINKEYKLSCKKCGNDWGVCAKIQKKYFFIIKVDTLEVIVDGVAEKVERWADLPYTLKFISDWQLLRFGHETIPDDYPLPNRWYTPA